MDSKRAKEIMGSGDVVQVLYEGSPVWLENVNDNNTAEIVRLDGREKKRGTCIPVG